MEVKEYPNPAEEILKAVITNDSQRFNKITRDYPIREEYKKAGVYDHVIMNIGQAEMPHETDPIKVRIAGQTALYQMFNTDMMNARANLMNATTNKRQQDLLEKPFLENVLLPPELDPSGKRRNLTLAEFSVLSDHQYKMGMVYAQTRAATSAQGESVYNLEIRNAQKRVQDTWDNVTKKHYGTGVPKEQQIEKANMESAQLYNDPTSDYRIEYDKVWNYIQQVTPLTGEDGKNITADQLRGELYQIPNKGWRFLFGIPVIKRLMPVFGVHQDIYGPPALPGAQQGELEQPVRSEVVGKIVTEVEG